MNLKKNDLELIIDYGFKVFEKQVNKTEAIKLLHEKHNYNTSSVTDYINNIGHLMNGRKYTRTMNYLGTRIAFDYILENYSENFFVNALSATKQHIEYYEKISQIKVVKLKQLYEEYSEKVSVKNLENKITLYNDEKLNNKSHGEGRVLTVNVNIYERNTTARNEAIRIHGCYCHICGFDFESQFGEWGKGYIHVHHLIPMYKIKEEYTIDPKTDLLPVCPNCHAIIHKNEDKSIEEIKKSVRYTYFNTNKL